MSQTALVLCIHFFIKLQNSVEVDATYSLPSDPAVNATYLASSLINHKNAITDYREACYKTWDETL